jgi:proline racemase
MMPGMRLAKVIHCVDAHAEGEPSRIVVGGVLDVPGESMLDKLRHLEREGDALRRLLLFEPRGSAPLSADLVLPSHHPQADAGFVIMESCSYEGMSGTNTINTATVLLETGMVPVAEPQTELTLEAPAGLVRVVADCAGGPLRARDVPRTFRRSPRTSTPASTCPGSVSCAWTSPTAARSARSSTRARSATRSSRRGARAAGAGRAHPPGDRRAARDRPSGRAGARRAVVRRADRAAARRRARAQRDRRRTGALDRSPTGTATSARLAVLDARGEAPGEFVNESVISTRFSGRIAGRTRVGEHEAIVPAITGRAWITGFHQLVVEPG